MLRERALTHPLVPWPYLQLGSVRRVDGTDLSASAFLPAFPVLIAHLDIYYLAFPKDRHLPKYLVAFVYVLELAQTVLSTRDSFRNFGTGWGNMEDLDTVGWLWFSVPVLGSISAHLLSHATTDTHGTLQSAAWVSFSTRGESTS